MAYVGIELESIKNETLCDCRGYNCGISKFSGMSAEDIKANFEDRLQKLEGDQKYLMSTTLFPSRCAFFNSHIYKSMKRMMNLGYKI